VGQGEVMPQQIPGIGQDVTALMPQIGEDVTALMASHDPTPEAPPEHPHARTWRLVKENAPLVGGAIGAAVTGGASLPVQALAAATGGGLASLARGDSPSDAASNAMWEGGTQGIGGLAVKGGKAIARGLMKGTVPKNIGKEFDNVDVAQEMLDRGVLPGSARSQQRVGRLSTAANAERDAAAQVVPPMPRSKVIAGLRPLHAEAVAAKEPEIASAMLEHMRASARNIGRDGLTGPQALARKDVKQRLSTAALNNPNTAAHAPQAANAERAAIASHLRETPRMATALDESQTWMAIEQVMKDASHSNPVTRMRIGGPTAGMLSPIGLGATAHAVNQGSRVVDPQILRAMQIAILSGQQE
jgi:hypothetical protein